MTAKRKWPHHAEWARQDAIACFAAVRKQLRDAQQIMLTSPLEAMVVLGMAADKTLEGETILRRAKDGEA